MILDEKSGIDPDSIINVATAADRSALEEAVDWLSDVLADGPEDSAEVKKWAKAADISVRTLQRARTKAGVVVTRRDSERGRPSVWELKGFGPKVSCQPPMEGNPQLADQGEQASQEGFRATPENGTKPPPGGLDSRVDEEDW